MMIDNLHDIRSTETVLWNVTSKSSVSIQFEAHGSYFFGFGMSRSLQIFCARNSMISR